MKIDAKKIGFDKPFDVKPSVKLERKSDLMTIKALQFQALDAKPRNLDPTKQDYADTLLKMYEEKGKLTDDSEKFLKDVFKLTAKQVDHLEENVQSMDELVEYVIYVIQRLQNMSDKQIELEQKKQAEANKEADPKK